VTKRSWRVRSWSPRCSSRPPRVARWRRTALPGGRSSARSSSPTSWPRMARSGAPPRKADCCAGCRARTRSQVIRRQPGRLRATVSRAWPVMAKDGCGRARERRGPASSIPAPRAGGRRRDRRTSSDSVTVLEPQGDTLWVGTTKGVALWNGRRDRGRLAGWVHVSFDTTFVNPHITGIAVLGDKALARHAARHRVGPPLRAAHRLATRERRLGSTDIADLASDGAELFARAGASVYRFRPDLGRWVLEGALGATRNLEDDNGVVLAPGECGTLPLASAGERHELGARRGRRGRGRGARGPRAQRGPFGAHLRAAGDTLYEWTGSSWNPHPTPAGPITNDVLAPGDRWSSPLRGPRTGGGFLATDGASWRVWPPHFCGAGCDTDTTFVQSASTFTLQVGFRAGDLGGLLELAAVCESVPARWRDLVFRDFGRFAIVDHQFVVEDISQTDRMRHTWVLPGRAIRAAGSGSARIRRPRRRRSDRPHVYDSSGVNLGSFDDTNTGMSGMSGRFVHGLAVTKNNRLWDRLRWEKASIAWFCRRRASRPRTSSISATPAISGSAAWRRRGFRVDPDNAELRY